VLSCRTKLEKLLCLKRRGSSASANTCGSQTTKLLPARLQETTVSVAGSSTRSNVLVRNGGGPTSWSPSIGRGASPPPPPRRTPSCSGCCSRSSSFTMPAAAADGSMAAAEAQGLGPREPRTPDCSKNPAPAAKNELDSRDQELESPGQVANSGGKLSRILAAVAVGWKWKRRGRGGEDISAP
jgi:hypothetical protein